MSQRPWFKQFASDFISGCTGMTGEQIGVYSILLNMMYARRKKLECRTPKDQQGLARPCGVTTRRFNQVVRELAAMPNKITIDAEGRLSNPKFERLMKEGGALDEPDSAPEPPPEEELTNSQTTLSPLFEPENAAKSRDNLVEKTVENEPVLNENKDLTAQNPSRARARARSICQKPERSSVTPPAQADAEHTPPSKMADDQFPLWRNAIKITFPRIKGWSQPEARKRWANLPIHPTEVWIDAWLAYIADVTAKSDNSKFKQRPKFPENWFQRESYRDWLDAALERQNQQHHRLTERQATIALWGEHATPTIAAITEDKFDAWFLGSTIKITAPAQATIAIPNEFQARWLIDHPALLQAISKALGLEIAIQGPERRRA